MSELELAILSCSILSVVNTRLSFVITRLRLGLHSLMSETGSWQRPKIVFNERLCESFNVIEDEFHFVFECKKYDVLRTKYLKRFYMESPSMFKFINMFSSSCRVLTNFAIYVKKAFAQRKTSVANVPI